MNKQPLEALALTAVLLFTAGCHTVAGQYTRIDDWIDDKSADGEYVIRPGDVLSVQVFNQPNMSARSRVRSDGKISLPFLNDVMAAGATPNVLGAQMQTRLKEFINNPVVTISLEEVRQLSISVIGEVARPGIYPLEPGATVLQAMAAAGGFTNFAYKDVFVLRVLKPGEPPRRIRFDWEKLTRAEGKGATFQLKPGDVVIGE